MGSGGFDPEALFASIEDQAVREATRQYAPWKSFRCISGPVRVIAIERGESGIRLVTVGIKDGLLDFKTNVDPLGVEETNEMSLEDQTQINSLAEFQRPLFTDPAGFVMAGYIFEMLQDFAVQG